ncbi:vegetative cell wall protein gp1-like [Zingiber officinale]|uniref:vegetative cell wall protein gp1-like n=1 Tax=Zingiber officinale TaxID=94328 RepID=UPI001C4D61CF|nr:vegetative cell wall protein gp1-like [Zingiber officinale]
MKHLQTANSTRVLVSRRGAGRPRKRASESLATESPERSVGIEHVSQGQTPQDTAGASSTRIPTVPSPELPTPTVFTVPPAVPTAYPAPPPPVPVTAYSTPPPVVPKAYLVPSPIVPPAAPAYIDPAVPPVVLAPTYVEVPGVPPPAYPTVPLVVPAPVVPPVSAAITTQPTDMIAA